MGMYDNVRLEIKCPNCGSTVSGFQSKDGPCDLRTLKFYEVNNFYSECDHCGCWIEYNKWDRRKLKLSDYKLSVFYPHTKRRKNR